jgi:hypothetical protein
MTITLPAWLTVMMLWALTFAALLSLAKTILDIIMRVKYGKAWRLK